MSLAACAPSPSFEDDVAAARATSQPAAHQAAAPAPTASPSSTIDPWAGHYDERMRNRNSTEAMAMYGSFGAPGSVSPRQVTNLGLEPGDHFVQFECVGLATVDVALSTPAADGDAAIGEGEQLDTIPVECPAVLYITVTTHDPGLVVGVDSHGEPGAFLVRVDPSDVSITE
jgi:hypothetical protein